MAHSTLLVSVSCLVHYELHTVLKLR